MTKLNFIKNSSIIINALLLIISAKLLCNETEEPMVIIIPSYNNIKYYEKNLDSVKAQSKTYSNWRAIYVDDCSKDGTGTAVEKYIKDNNLENKITLIKNKNNMGAMCNWYNAIHSCKDNEIIVSLDGDDWLADDQVLSYINKIYQDNNVWMTYGQFMIYPSGQIGKCRTMPDFVIKNNSFREYEWISSHLRTFYAGLFKKIKLEDFMLDGKFLSMTCDMAIMLPLLEMAGPHIKFIDKILYIYNYTNSISDFRKDSQYQIYVENYIRNKEKYKRLNSIN